MEATDQGYTRHDGRERSRGTSWSSAAEDIKGVGQEAAEGFKRQAGEFAETQKNAGAEQIGGVARAVHSAAQQMESDYPHTASYIHGAADRIQRASSSLRERSVDDLIGAFSRFAREQPVTVFGGALIASLALTRFVKSSSERSYPAGPRSDFTNSSLSDLGRPSEGDARAAYAVGESDHAHEGAGGRLFKSFREQPLFLIGAGVVLGAVLGSSIPPTQTEDELMGETRDRLKDRAEEIASEQYESARETARNIYEDGQKPADEPSIVPAPVMPETAPFDRVSTP
ncbi:MAG TPA: hypothetical protein VFT69_11205 [Pseudolabrys sp.]|jgi:hypothetical protein|nr:hypothetical protein [Pseudolabrys sp.]